MKPDKALSGLRVLIIEDEPLIALTTEEDLRALGCAGVFIAYRRAEALAALGHFAPHLAVLYFDLDFADSLVQAGVPFVFLTAHTQDEIPARHSQRPFVSKPCEPQTLARAISAAIGGHHATLQV